MREFFSGAFYAGIAILIVAAAMGGLENFTPLVIWTTGMAVGLLGTKPSA